MSRLDALALFNKFGVDRIDLLADAAECEKDFSTFFQRSWHVYDASPYHHNWHIDAVADHLMAVADGEIRRLMINLPPRASKTREVTVAFPAWLWALRQNSVYPLHGASCTFLCLSYGATKSKEEASTSKVLIKSQWYQDRWGRRVQVSPIFDNQERFDTTAGGSRISTGIVGGVLGRGGLIKIIDDAMKPDEPASEKVGPSVIREYDETISSRENDPRIAAEIVIAQRLDENDLPGHILSKYGSDPDRGGFCHLMIPAEYESERHCVTVLGWQDPRGSYRDKNGDVHMLPDDERAEHDGESFWPDRFSSEVLEQRKTAEGPFSWAAKYQQRPAPRGGGIIDAAWWKLWNSEAFPDFTRVLVSVDTAQTEKEINDEAGITVWGIFEGDKGMPLVMLINAWEGRLKFNPLVLKIAELCKKHKADICLIEGKSNGIDVINEIKRLFGSREWATRQFDPKTDKVSRLTSVQATWSGKVQKDLTTGEDRWVGGVVYAPDKDYATLAIDRVSAFPMGKKKAIVDTASQAIIWMRRNGWIKTPGEHDEDLEEDLKYKPIKKPVYDV